MLKRHCGMLRMACVVIAGVASLLMQLDISALQAYGERASQGQSQSSFQKTLSPEKIAELLRQPNGLSQAANLVGTFVINGQIRPWSNDDLSTLVASSSLIVLGKITARTSQLSEDGDDINTEYTVDTSRVLKGTVSGSITFSAHGGLVQFPNGTSAQVTTVEWKHLLPGQQYVLFLRHEQDGRYYLANGVEALFKLSTADGNIEALASHDRGAHRITDEVKGTSVSSFLEKIQALAASKVPH